MDGLGQGIETELVADGGHDTLPIQGFPFDGRRADGFGNHEIQHGLGAEFVRKAFKKTADAARVISEGQQKIRHPREFVAESRPVRLLPIVLHEPIIEFNRLKINYFMSRLREFMAPCR